MNKKADVVKHDFLIGTYERVGDVSVLKLFSFETYVRVRNVFTLFGFGFLIK